MHAGALIANVVVNRAIPARLERRVVRTLPISVLPVSDRVTRPKAEIVVVLPMSVLRLCHELRALARRLSGAASCEGADVEGPGPRRSVRDPHLAQPVAPAVVQLRARAWPCRNEIPNDLASDIGY